MAFERSANFSDELTEGRNSVGVLYCIVFSFITRHGIAEMIHLPTVRED